MVLVVTQPLVAFGSSFSRPWLVKCGSEEYLLKFFNGNDNSLASEFICDKIARKIDLTVPDTSPILIENDEVEIINKAKKEKGEPLITVGEYFGSKFIDNAYSLNHERHTALDPNDISNLGQVSGMILFDTFVDNGNRSEINALMRPVDEEASIFEYVLIDEGHCFNDPGWNKDSIKNIQYNVRNIPWKKDWLTGESDFKDYIEKFNSLEKTFYKEIIDDVPSKWKPRPDDFDALLNFLVSRDVKQALQAMTNWARDNIKQLPSWK